MDSLERRLLVCLLEEVLPAIRRHFEVPDAWNGTVWPLEQVEMDTQDGRIRNGGYCPSCSRGSFNPHASDCNGMRLVADLTRLVARMKTGAAIVGGSVEPEAER